MEITKDKVAKKMLGYMKRKISLTELVDWAERAVMDGKFKSGEEKILRDVTGRLGLADVKTFGLSWEDCDSLMKKLGYKIKINAIAA
ncbi:MAG: hypothetical protein WCI97_06405 [Bacteroidota bacterium]